MEADRLQDSQSASCRSRMVMVPFQSQGSQAQDSRQADVSAHVQRREKTDIPAWRQSVKRNFFRLEGGQHFCSLLFFRGLMRPTTLGRVICFTQTTDSDVSFFVKCSQRYTQNNVVLVKLTHKINCHIFLEIFLLKLFSSLLPGRAKSTEDPSSPPIISHSLPTPCSSSERVV